MAEQSKAHVKCPECGQRYRWKEHHAGRRVRCGNCEAKLRYPEDSTGSMRVLDPSPKSEEAAASPASHQPESPSSATPTSGPDPDPSPEMHSDISHNMSGPTDATGPQQQPAADTYDLADDPDADLRGSAASKGSTPAGEASASTQPGRCPQCNSKLKPGAAVCMNCGFDLSQGQSLKTEVGSDNQAASKKDGGELHGSRMGQSSQAERESEADSSSQQRGSTLVDQQREAEEPAAVTDFQAQRKRDESRKAMEEDLKQQQFRRQEYVYPSLVLLAGAVLQYLHLLMMGETGVAGAGIAVIAIGAQLIIMVPMLLGVLFAATQFGMAFGNLWTALLKLAGIALLPMAVAAFLSAMFAIPIPLFPLIVWVGTMGIGTWFLLETMFDMDYAEGAQLAVVLVVVQIVTSLVALYAIPAMI